MRARVLLPNSALRRQGAAGGTPSHRAHPQAARGWLPARHPVARAGRPGALQLVDVQCQRAEVLHFPQQRAHVGATRISLLDGDQVSAGKRRLESHARITVHPYSVSAGQCSLPNFGQARE